MGKAAKKRRDEKHRLLFEAHGDDRDPQARAQARAMLDALQKKLDDDALREDGFYFLDGKYVAARRPRVSAGMKMRAFDGHKRSVKCAAFASCSSAKSDRDEEGGRCFVVTFGLDR